MPIRARAPKPYGSAVSNRAVVVTKPEDDADYFGKDAFVYCASHLRPHLTGWCTVPLTEKVRLHALNYEEANDQCRRLKLPLFEDKA
jgi:hypothetical protein